MNGLIHFGVAALGLGALALAGCSGGIKFNGDDRGKRAYFNVTFSNIRVETH